MKIKFTTFSQIKEYMSRIHVFASGILIKSGSLCVDGTSLMGILSLDTNKILELVIVEEKNNESDLIHQMLREIGVLAE